VIEEESSLSVENTGLSKEELFEKNKKYILGKITAWSNEGISFSKSSDPTEEEE